MISAENIKDIHELQDKASALNSQDFNEWVQSNFDYRVINEDYMDFNYKSIGATCDNDKLCGRIDCYDEDGQWIDTIDCEDVEFN